MLEMDGAARRRYAFNVGFPWGGRSAPDKDFFLLLLLLLLRLAAVPKLKEREVRRDRKGKSNEEVNNRKKKKKKPAKEPERDPLFWGCWRVDKGKKQREGMTEHARRQNLKKQTKTKTQTLPGPAWTKRQRQET
ncbi:uncharacterized protein ARB_01320 [Trichophyton benhamiae CBS 112371]|uniref:Uncharacterized protein n=1 Tax=Arthroderma benhamiae (strain ATCC MYA-4681 / CBS 112371) TaxID=663331 RepID=D4AYQ1_ARTBC|nr:uncharacterized protein ARB_01320 [Trichophyton benhamiae CBS 112371]EFE31721.1 hypothetical protein ARB_01320 [Trichophyton benhamiae CBS 112371]